MSWRFLIASVAVGCAATPVWGHAFLQRAVPGAGVTIAAPPKRIALSFTEKLEPAFSGIGVTDSSGHDVKAGAVQIGGNAMVAPIRPLAPGTYRVSWHAVSVDTHRTEGAYNFTVKP